MIIGFTSLMLFIKSNASVVEATVTGSFRPDCLCSLTLQRVLK